MLQPFENIFDYEWCDPDVMSVSEASPHGYVELTLENDIATIDTIEIHRRDVVALAQHFGLVVLNPYEERDCE